MFKNKRLLIFVPFTLLIKKLKGYFASVAFVALLSSFVTLASAKMF